MINMTVILNHYVVPNIFYLVLYTVLDKRWYMFVPDQLNILKQSSAFIINCNYCITMESKFGFSFKKKFFKGVWDSNHLKKKGHELIRTSWIQLMYLLNKKVLFSLQVLKLETYSCMGFQCPIS